MRRIIMTATVLAGFTLGTSAYAWECPQHFAEAQEALKASAQALEKNQETPNSPLAHTLQEDAKMLLAGGIGNHENPIAGEFDHARAIAKAKAAKGYAQTAKDLAGR